MLLRETPLQDHQGVFPGEGRAVQQTPPELLRAPMVVETLRSLLAEAQCAEAAAAGSVCQMLRSWKLYGLQRSGGNARENGEEDK